MPHCRHPDARRTNNAAEHTGRVSSHPGVGYLDPMQRRTFLAHAALLTAGACARPSIPGRTSDAQVMTVDGPIRPEALGVALPHEHVMSTFGGDPSPRGVYDEAALIEAVVPYLQHVKSLGADTLFDATAAYFGRAPELLQRLSRASGLQIVTNTGYYGAADDRYVPAHAYEETAEALAQRWLREWETGIDGTGIRPGFVKVGVDGSPLSALDRKLVRAAALTHLGSGLTLAIHTGGDPAAAAAQLAILREEGVHPSAWIWVHAHNVDRAEALLPAAEAGAWIELDGLSENTLDHHVSLAEALRARGLLGQVLLSHDGNSYRYGGGPMRPYEALFTHALPRLRARGFSQAEIQQLTAENPQRAFTIRVRTA